jgi:hypothetical protein
MHYTLYCQSRNEAAPTFSYSGNQDGVQITATEYLVAYYVSIISCLAILLRALLKNRMSRRNI